jgi:hypothetical protein
VTFPFESAIPHEVTLASSTLLQMVVPDALQNLIGDNAYDSGRLDSELSIYEIGSRHSNESNGNDNSRYQ